MVFFSRFEVGLMGVSDRNVEGDERCASNDRHVRDKKREKLARSCTSFNATLVS